jgi:hypothetical protein
LHGIATGLVVSPVCQGWLIATGCDRVSSVVIPSGIATGCDHVARGGYPIATRCDHWFDPIIRRAIEDRKDGSMPGLLGIGALPQSTKIHNNSRGETCISEPVHSLYIVCT